MPCRPINLGGVTGIACSRGERVKRCTAPGCNDRAAVLCDYRLHNGKTCDRALCSSHKQRPDKTKDVDYCGPHARMIEAGIHSGARP
jgi:hypothetical protein